MCEFCVSHGDGKRWYLNASNYTEDLLQDPRRRRYIRDFIPDISRRAPRWLRFWDALHRLSPRLAGWAGARQAQRMKAIHYGQVIPLEDVAAVLEVTGQVMRLPCVCREALQKREEAVCYLLAADPRKMGFAELFAGRFADIPFAGSLEPRTAEQAQAEMEALEGRGRIHTIWTFLTPFVGAICNCDPSGCLAMNFSARGFPLYFPGEASAEADRSCCAGCGDCLESCLFGAITLTDGQARVDADRCRGCGICRRACAAGALSLRSRPQAAQAESPIRC